jgi:nucleoside-diphosphate-sugar epimerase
MQTILGSGGVIANGLAKGLPKYSNVIRLVSRNPKAVNPTDQLFPADLTNAEQTLKAVEGSEIVYLTVGLPYNIKVWQEQWSIIMKNVIGACKTHNSKLVFFDNVYLYGKVDGWMTENTRVQPCSKKGEVRAKIVKMLTEEIENGKLTALIARAPDFYGPKTPLSFFNAMVIENLKKGKRPQWMVNDKVKHSLIFTPDAAEATAILGNTVDAFNQVWHLPTDRNPLTGRELIELAANVFKTSNKYTVLSKFMLKIIRLFIPVVKEGYEMLSQNEQDYLFDSSKFEKRFNYTPTSYAKGIAMTVESVKN